MIVGTAGHIDHGKTRLVRALTGVDTDRLPEEKRRGITIELGFAPLSLPKGGRAGVVDVPGHERFVRTMVAGAVGIDVALLVVAADEGVMPQTREHLEICGLLGIGRGVVALSKVDKSGPELAALAAEDVAAAVKGSFLEHAPVVPCSAETGQGLPELLAALEAALVSAPARDPGARFFLPVDRALSVRGFGTVVTGTVLSGTAVVGDEVEILPPPPGRRALRGRIRSLEQFGGAAEKVAAGERAAVAIAGVERSDVGVGDALVAPGSAVGTRRISARIHHLAGRDRDLPTGARLALHLGTRTVAAGLTLFEVDRLPPGGSGMGTLRLAESVAGLPGQRFILRGFDAPGLAGRTIGGGVLLDPEPPRRRRRDPVALAAIGALEGDSPQMAAAALAKEAGFGGVERTSLGRRLGLGERRLDRAVASLESIPGFARYFHQDALGRLEAPLLAAVAAFHAEQPAEAGVTPQELATRVGGPLRAEFGPRLAERVAKALVRAGRLKEKSGRFFVAGAGSGGDLSAAVLAAIEAGDLEPPGSAAIAAAIRPQAAEPAVRAVLGVLAKAGAAVHAKDGIYFSRASLDRAAARLSELPDGPFTAADAKRLFGLSRKYLIPLLETFDRLGVTARRGDHRERRRPAAG